MPEMRAIADRLFWKAWFVLYGGFIAVDLVVVILSGDGDLLTLSSSLMGIIAAVPMFGYAFRCRLGASRLWQVLFLISVLALCWLIGSIVIEMLDQDGRTYSFWVGLVIPAAFLIYYPWFAYAFRSPEIWKQEA